MDHSAQAINEFQALGVGELCYLKVLDCDDVKALVGADAEIEKHETAVCLVDADGSPILLRGSVGACMIAAAERDLHIVPIN
jgi:hypothetical protein